MINLFLPIASGLAGVYIGKLCSPNRQQISHEGHCIGIAAIVLIIVYIIFRR